MPLTRIVVQAGRTESELKIISDTLHQTLVDTFHVPPDDCFQLIDEYPSDRLVVNQHYLTGERSSKYTLFSITAGKPRDQATKARFYQMLCDRLVERMNMSPDDVMVVIQFTNPDDWSFSGGKLFRLPSDTELS
ncbi:tautomerase family protein [Photobacterium salinisoli]|uniref:tautomerase family protein n=1 Tax=Photobacterium salinisoli TaxID=1616783 RepID=UPI000EA302D3|nr:tautomerase family protein [Photobacterium salinisoli]